jgi:hypothetical protein
MPQVQLGGRGLLGFSGSEYDVLVSCDHAERRGATP